MANALLEYETLTAEEIKQILNPNKQILNPNQEEQLTYQEEELALT